MNIVGQGSILWVSDFTLMCEFYEKTLGLLPAQGDPVEGWMPFKWAVARLRCMRSPLHTKTMQSRRVRAFVGNHQQNTFST